MNVVLIYGPPAVGKLTTAKELSKLTGYKIFHNHLTVNLVYSIFESKSETGEALSQKLRLEVVKNAVNSNLEGLIMTYVYEHPINQDYIEKLIQTVEQNNGNIYFVQLLATKETLKNRVNYESRKIHNKISDFEKLQRVMSESEMLTPIQVAPSLIIENSNKNPELVAHEIARKFALVDEYDLEEKLVSVND